MPTPAQTDHAAGHAPTARTATREADPLAAGDGGPDADPEVLVVGEVLADIVRRADGGVTTHPGGSPGNVAVGLARLGRRVTLLTELADDVTGAVVRTHLEGAGVRVLAVPPSRGRTATATATLDISGGAHYAFDIGWDLADAPAVPRAPHVHIGSIGAFLAPGADAVEALVRAIRPDATVSLDPNVRPALMGSREAALGRLERVLALVDVVKVSDEDLAWLHPGEAPREVLNRWLASGPSVVVLTLGGRGSVGVCASGEAAPAPRTVDVVDTVGAGDAYMSALVDGLGTAGLLGAERRDALRHVPRRTLDAVLDRCADAASITVARRGAEPPTSADLGPLQLAPPVGTL